MKMVLKHQIISFHKGENCIILRKKLIIFLLILIITIPILYIIFNNCIAINKKPEDSIKNLELCKKAFTDIISYDNIVKDGMNNILIDFHGLELNEDKKEEILSYIKQFYNMPVTEFPDNMSVKSKNSDSMYVNIKVNIIKSDYTQLTCTTFGIGGVGYKANYQYKDNNWTLTERTEEWYS